MTEKNLIGSETEKNLMIAFAGESQARNRYSYYASAAKKEGYEQISKIFLETADNEKEHAKVFFKYLDKSKITITAPFLTGLGKTEENLKISIEGEHEENTTLYPSFAKIAKKEGFDEIAKSFEEVAEAEKHHEKRYKKLLSNLENNEVFCKKEIVEWKCLNCGYIHGGKKAPLSCPSCKHPQKYFEINCDNF